MEQEFLGMEDLFLILSGIVMGTVARIVTLKVDSRQNPSYPNGYFINLVTGFIAACLGAVAIPALLAKNFTAVTFLTLAIQHFREIRKVERDSLASLDNMEYTTRGDAYIDGIAKTYEARNYISLLTSLGTVFVANLLYTGSLLTDCIIAVVSGSIIICLLYRFTKGKTVGDVCTVKEGEITTQGSELFVDGIFVTSTLGTERSRTFFEKEGVAYVIHPNQERSRLTLENFGQRQAILFEAIRSFGVKRYKFTHRSFSDGRVVIAFVPIIADKQGILKAIEHTPILESSRKIQL